MEKAEAEVCPFVNSNRRWGYMNTRGEAVIKPVFSAAYDFFPDHFAIVFKGENAGLVNKRGEEGMLQRLILPNIAKDLVKTL